MKHNCRILALSLAVAVTGCSPLPEAPGIVVRMVERGNAIVASSYGAAPAQIRTCADGTTPAAFAGVTGPAVLIPQRLGKATFVVTYVDPDGLRFIDAGIALSEAGVVSTDGGEHPPGQFYAASQSAGQTAEFRLIITPLTDASGYATLTLTATDETETTTRLTLAIALERRVCPQQP